jgi:metal-dependent HD superfamily phosphatase/phosphodiesterase
MMRPDANVAVYVCIMPVDMSKQATTLSLLVEQALKKNINFGMDSARGRTRTDTLLKAVDFHLTSAFAALSVITQVRGLEHAFTLAARL